jgi:5-methylcytosine-specific restriction endonuclease McrA
MKIKDDLTFFINQYPFVPNLLFMERYSLREVTILYHAHKYGLKKDPSYISAIRKEEHLGKSPSKETRQKIATTLKGKKQAAGRAQKAIATARARGTQYRGSRHHWWQGGTTPLRHRYADPRYSEWRTAVMNKYDWTCQECGKKGDRKKRTGLDAHHIKGWTAYPEFRYVVDNGIPLCRPCHKREHRRLLKGEGYWI